jgi:hypothetical protein
MLEIQLGEFDYLFQEGVLIPKKDIERFDFLMNRFSELRNEIKQHPSGDFVNNIFTN